MSTGVGETFLGMSCGNRDHFHSGGESSFHADVSVFDDQTVGRFSFDFFGSFEENVWTRFAAGNVFGADVMRAEV